MTNVLHVYRTYFPDTQGGLEEVIRQICVNTATQGVVSKVFTLSNKPDPGEIELAEAQVVRVKKHLEPASCSISFTALSKFKVLVAWADVVHYHYPWPFGDLLHLIAATNKPAIVTYHSDIVRQRILGLVYKPLQLSFFKHVDRVVCTSPNYRDSSVFLQTQAKKLELIPIGLSTETYPGPDENIQQEIEKKWGRDFFLFIGVLRYYKGLHVLLDALVGTQHKLVIVGSGPEEASLKKQVSRLDLDNVVFTGFVSDEEKVAFLGLCRAVVFPSHLRSEAFGVTLLEGAMHGKPLVSTEVGTGTSYVNEHRNTGIVVRPDSAGELRSAMDELAEDEAGAASMGRNARLRFDRLFTGKTMGDRYAAIYRQLMSCPPADSR